MSTQEANLFAVTPDHRLFIREATDKSVPWTRIGNAPGAVITSLGTLLWCATSANALMARVAARKDLAWSPIGHANYVTALAAAQGKLFVIYHREKQLRLATRAPLLHNVDWADLGESPEGVLAMTTAGDDLFVVTADNELYRRRAVADPAGWERYDYARNAIALAGTSKGLFVNTRDNELMFLNIATKEWSKPVDSQPVKSMTLADVVPAPWVELEAEEGEELRTGTEG